jgi:hypothetical protein
MGGWHYSGRRARVFFGWVVCALYRYRLAIGRSPKKGHFLIMFGTQHPHKRAIRGGSDGTPLPLAHFLARAAGVAITRACIVRKGQTRETIP